MQEPVAQIAELPLGHSEFLTTLKERIRNSRVRAVMAVNRELVLLYWRIGRDILERQEQQGWGTKIIDRLATDLRREFPEIKGFSPRNLKYMRAFAQAWPDAAERDLQRGLEDHPRNRIVAEYALRDVHKPLGVATYQWTESLPESFKGSLPTVEVLEAELSGLAGEEDAS